MIQNKYQFADIPAVNTLQNLICKWILKGLRKPKSWIRTQARE